MLGSKTTCLNDCSLQEAVSWLTTPNYKTAVHTEVRPPVLVIVCDGSCPMRYYSWLHNDHTLGSQTTRLGIFPDESHHRFSVRCHPWPHDYTWKAEQCIQVTAYDGRPLMRHHSQPHSDPTWESQIACLGISLYVDVRIPICWKF